MGRRLLGARSDRGVETASVVYSLVKWVCNMSLIS